MIYEITKMGLGDSQVTIPANSRQKIHVVGLISDQGKFILTHTSLDELLSLKDHISKIGISVSFNFCSEDTVSKPSSHNFTLNGGTQWDQKIEGRPVCRVAYFDGHPESMFFVPDSLFEGECMQLIDAPLGIFDITGTQPVVLGQCAASTTLKEIVSNIKQLY